MNRVELNIGFQQSDIILNDSVLEYIIENYTDEDGVRQFKRCLETLISKLNLLKLINSSTSGPNVDFYWDEFELPIQITNKIVNKLLKKEENNSKFAKPPMMMYV